MNKGLAIAGYVVTGLSAVLGLVSSVIGAKQLDALVEEKATKAAQEAVQKAMAANNK